MNASTIVAVLSAQPARVLVSTSLQRCIQAGRHLWHRHAGRAARQTPSDPAAEAAAVRALAYRHRRTDPGFAADLYAAADRHERDSEGRRA